MSYPTCQSYSFKKMSFNDSNLTVCKLPTSTVNIKTFIRGTLSSPNSHVYACTSILLSLCSLHKCLLWAIEWWIFSVYFRPERSVNLYDRKWWLSDEGLTKHSLELQYSRAMMDDNPQHVRHFSLLHSHQTLVTAGPSISVKWVLVTVCSLHCVPIVVPHAH